ncbi:MAG TPA: GNAT family N-acetyltransferase [Candidatus Limnocylindrales bacterium]
MTDPSEATGRSEPAATSLDATRDLRIVDNASRRRYEAVLGDEVVGFSEYARTGSRIVFLHTEVAPDHEGRGVGSRLAAGALDDVRAQGLKVTARCPFIAAYLRRHPEYRDLLAQP